MYCIFNGSLIPESEAHFPVNDLGMRRGYGIFDFFRVRNDVPLYVKHHVGRFLRGAAEAGIHHGYGEEQLLEQVKQVIAANKGILKEAAVRILLTGGPGSWTADSPNVVMTYEPLNEYPAAVYQEGVPVITHEFLRELPLVKTISYMTAISLTEKMKEANALEVLYHRNGVVTEFSRSNVFIVRDGNILTPGRNILPGITRALIREICGEYGYHETDLSLEDVKKADEVFMTSTIKRIIPVRKIDGVVAGEGRPGAVTRELMKRLAVRDRQELEEGISVA